MRLGANERREILEARRYCTLATLNDDGSILVTPVWYLFEDGRFYVATASSSRKARNLSARPNATIMVDIRKLGNESWVSASGRVEILTGERSRAISSKIQRRYLTPAALEDPRTAPVFEASDDITITLFPETWRSWSAKDMDERYFDGVLSSDPAKWFLPVES